jgi:WD40 repeat protein
MQRTSQAELIAVSPSGGFVAAYFDNQVRVWRVHDGQECGVLHAQYSCRFLQFDATGMRLASVQVTFEPKNILLSDFYVCIWTAVGPVGLVAPDVTYQDSSAVRVSIGTAYAYAFKGEGELCVPVALSPSGVYFAGPSEHGLQLWLASTGERLTCVGLEFKVCDVACVAFSPGVEPLLAVGRKEGLVDVCRVSVSGSCNHWSSLACKATCLSFGADGQVLACMLPDAVLVVWAMQTGVWVAIARLNAFAVDVLRSREWTWAGQFQIIHTQTDVGAWGIVTLGLRSRRELVVHSWDAAARLLRPGRTICVLADACQLWACDAHANVVATNGQGEGSVVTGYCAV